MKSVIPTDKTHWLQLRSQNINSTEVSALFGLSPYQTKFELYYQKKVGYPTQIEESERMKWGTRLQNSIAQGIAEDKNWSVVAMPEYIYDEKLKVGSSFDFKVTDPQKAILEVKNVDGLIYRNQWAADDNGGIEAPPHIEMQVQHQMYCADLDRAYIGVLVGGNTIQLIERTRDEEIIKEQNNEIEKFWESIASGKPPTPDFEKDSAFITKLYSRATEGKVISLQGNSEINELALHYKQLSDAIKDYEVQKDAIKAQLLMAIGDNEKALGDLFTISAGMVNKETYTVQPFSYRNFRLNWKKLK